MYKFLLRLLYKFLLRLMYMFFLRRYRTGRDGTLSLLAPSPRKHICWYQGSRLGALDYLIIISVPDYLNVIVRVNQIIILVKQIILLSIGLKANQANLIIVKHAAS